MSAEIRWTPSRHAQLAAQLTGTWAEDVWVLPDDHNDAHHVIFRFTCPQATLNTELKYALWSRYDRKEWRVRHEQWARHFQVIVRWLTATAPETRSLLERSREAWELSLRTHLTDRQRYRPRAMAWLASTQEYRDSRMEDVRVLLLRRLYDRLAEDYDDRPEWEKDRWDLRKLGMDVDPTRSVRTVTFTRIAQPWLRDLAKRFTRYNTSIHTPADCIHKVTALNGFSAFLAARHPAAGLAAIDRALMVDYLQYMAETQPSVNHRASVITRLRTILEVCAHHLQVPGLTRERVIFDEDLPKRVKVAPRDLPEGVLAQFYRHLEALPTPVMRMAAIMLECMLRVGEACALPLDCLAQDSQGLWSLHFYQRKLKQDHVVPVVDPTVVEAIQRQQEEVRARHGGAAPWLFPNPQRPDRPYQTGRVMARLNEWAVAHAIVGPDGTLWRFQPHQFRHTGAQRLLDRGVSLQAISRLLGHSTLAMTQVYASKRQATIRTELERTIRSRVTVDADGQVVRGDPRGDDADLELLRQDLRGAALPIGTCGRLRVLGACAHEHACGTCRFWRTSTEDLPKLDEWIRRQERLLPLAQRQGNERLAASIERLLPPLRERADALREHSARHEPSPEERLAGYRADLTLAEAGLAEAHAARLWLAVKAAEQRIAELQLRIAGAEMEGRHHGDTE